MTEVQSWKISLLQTIRLERLAGHLHHHPLHPHPPPHHHQLHPYHPSRPLRLTSATAPASSAAVPGPLAAFTVPPLSNPPLIPRGQSCCIAKVGGMGYIAGCVATGASWLLVVMSRGVRLADS